MPMPMNALIQLLNRHTFGLFTAIKRYCDFADRQARNEADLLLLGLGPIGLMALLIALLPKWLGITVALIFMVPAAYAVILTLALYSERSRQ
ncbi:conjugal transfer protein TrbO [Roseateles sp. GG27B]